MYNIVPLILILVSLVAIFFIISKKFSLLASVDVDSIPKEKEAKVKEQIISDRIKRNFVKWNAKFFKFAKFVLEKLAIFFKWIYKRLHEARDDYKTAATLEKGDIEETTGDILEEVRNLIDEEDYEKAEKKLIDIIGLDSKNIRAFEELAELYFKKKDYNEAIQTFEHVLKLSENDTEYTGVAEVLYNLALVSKEKEDLEGALDYIKDALKIEANNPRYLDTMLEISIMNKDKISALEAFKKLEEVNPDNQKLEELNEQIKEL